MSFYNTISPYLFKLEPENAHSFAEWTLKYLVPMPLVQDIVSSRCCIVDERLSMEVAGMRFYNPVGLAAGFDKNATMLKGLLSLGFGSIEIGTITQTPQTGNPKPRIFRFNEQRSLQNTMGFNNQGSAQIVYRLKKLHSLSVPLGINIGKDKIIEQNDSLKNYENTLRQCLEVGDYYVFNLSSPNTPRLRDLQNVKFVDELFSMARTHTDKPIFLKISPDMKEQEMLKVVEKAIAVGASGIIATNTTIDYSVLEGAKDSGGVSGEALKAKSKAALKVLSEAFFGKTELISVGGIDNADEAYERIKLGASLVQVYSGLIFEGPGLCKKINEGLLECLRRDGHNSLQEALGSSLRKGRKSSKSSADLIESAPKKRGRKPKNATQISSASVDSTPKKRGRKPKVATQESSIDSVKNLESAPKKRGRKPKNIISNKETSIPKKRGRKPKLESLADKATSTKTPSKRGRKPKIQNATQNTTKSPKTKVAKVADSTPNIPKKRGRKPKATQANADSIKNLKSTKSIESTPKKRGRKPKSASTKATSTTKPATSGASRRGRPRKNHIAQDSQNAPKE